MLKMKVKEIFSENLILKKLYKYLQWKWREGREKVKKKKIDKIDVDNVVSLTQQLHYLKASIPYSMYLEHSHQNREQLAN